MFAAEAATTRNAWQSPACSPPGAKAPAKPRDYWTKVYKIFKRLRGIIDDANASIHVTIHSPL